MTNLTSTQNSVTHTHQIGLVTHVHNQKTYKLVIFNKTIHNKMKCVVKLIK